ncbi:OadG family protein [Vreelandella jeotgali]|uniref:OadG family protein n=1 Tax=Vreelandella jeotgali TaxID=553386 RepID=UPI00034837D5|nr:OadG family transporter subunit [Halomonas jeotgali]
MQPAELLREGFFLMSLGMGFVFVFLTVLVLVMTLMSALVRRFQPAPDTPVAADRAAPAASDAPGEETLAIIAAAIHRYRRSS